jgi:hypothetical protein
VAGLQQQIESLFTFLRIAFITRIILPCEIFMHAYKHWLDHDVVALAFLIVGIAAVELLAIAAVELLAMII